MQTKQKFRDKVYLPRNPNGIGSIVLPWGKGTITVDSDQIICAVTGNENLKNYLGEKKVGNNNALLKLRRNDYESIWFKCDVEAFNLSFRLAKAGYCVDYQEIAKQMPKPEAEKQAISSLAHSPLI